MIYVVWFTAVIISLSIHEFAHAAVAKMNGDDTAEEMGRLTLNPLAHVDMFGTVFLPILLLVSTAGQFAFGWAKPVPINPNQFRNQKKGEFQVSSAGIAANLILAVTFLVVLRLLAGFSSVSSDNMLVIFFQSLVFINLALALFNLLPLPPLDGSGILFSVLPDSEYATRLKLFLQTNGLFLLLLLLILDGYFDFFARAIYGVYHILVSLVFFGI
ncbi:MAG: site-2 protease family protein [Parcubacteria group bacterium]|nr:site-2 protease family protein [Parcubacteria group bacterium]